MAKLKVLDLFSGIGGFSLGLERTGGFETVAFCEIEPYPRAVLKKHWPKVPCYADVRTLTADALARDGISVDVISGGFPCQDISTAGKGRGIEGERSGLWGEIIRLACEIQPRFIIVENVSNLLAGDNGRWFGRVLADLAAIGFDAEWNCIPASDIGAPHLRDRVWVVAYPSQASSAHSQPQEGIFRPGQWESRGFSRNSGGASNWAGQVEPLPRMVRVADGVPNRVDRIAAIGNAVVPQIPELIGRAILQAEGRT